MNELAAAGHTLHVSASGSRLALPYFDVGEAAGGSDDEDLVARLRSGEVSALAEAYDAHGAHVRAFARRVTGDDAAAEDLVQETFLELPRAIGRFRGDSSLRTFVIAIAVNCTRHHVRAAARRRAAIVRYARESGPTSSTPADTAERAQLAAALVRALDTLSVDHRVTVILCEVEERTSIEVARIMGVPETTVRSRLHYARRKLIEALGKEGIQ